MNRLPRDALHDFAVQHRAKSRLLSRHLERRRSRHSRIKPSGSMRLQMESLEAREMLAGDVVISEFQASNKQTLTDEDGDFPDWIEIHNTSLNTVNLDGWYLTDNSQDLRKWQFSNVDIAADEYLVVFASNKDRTTDVNGNPVSELHTNFALSSSGEFLALVEPDGLALASEFSPAFPPQLTDQSYGLAVTVSYSDDKRWPQAADGTGATLELINPSTRNTLTNDKYYSWRSSREAGGTPGTGGAGPIGVVVNEVLVNTNDSPTLSDSIELYNRTSSSIEIGGWYLSDSGDNALKFQIPPGTILASRDYIVFDESDFNRDPDDGFALSGTNGDDVWLVVPDGSGGVASFIDDVHFGGASSLESFGRVPNGDGSLAPMGRITLGADNNQPRVGPLVISEVQYNPGLPTEGALALFPHLDSADLEFFEVHNPTMGEANLTDWRVRGGVDLDFDAGTVLAAGETIVVLPFDPNNVSNAARVRAFRAHYGIDNSVQLIGGYAGQLSDDGERVDLRRAEYPEPAQTLVVAHITEDEVSYDDLAPWDVDADGEGTSLQRLSPTFYGNAAGSWSAGSPTPGLVEFKNNQAGDITGDGMLDAADIDALYNAINVGLNVNYYDFDGSSVIDEADVFHLLGTLMGVVIGDADLDGMVDVKDLNAVGVNWQRSNGAGWADGDFTGDGIVSAADLNAVGINWRKVKPAAAAHHRAPRPPLAALRLLPIAVVDVAIDDLAGECRLAPNLGTGCSNERWNITCTDVRMNGPPLVMSRLPALRRHTDVSWRLMVSNKAISPFAETTRLRTPVLARLIALLAQADPAVEHPQCG